MRRVAGAAGGAFHNSFGIGDFNNRYQCTQGELLNLKDLNTQNENVQNMILDYLKSCVSAGASGFRYDAAKHIELPDESPENGKDFSSDFWPTILDNGSEFQYGEILQDRGSRTADYAKYMSVTASSSHSTLTKLLHVSDRRVVATATHAGKTAASRCFYSQEGIKRNTSILSAARQERC